MRYTWDLRAQRERGRSGRGGSPRRGSGLGERGCSRGREGDTLLRLRLRLGWGDVPREEPAKGYVLHDDAFPKHFRLDRTVSSRPT